jgi:hypothetical protein
LTSDQKLQLARKMQQDPAAAAAYYHSLTRTPPPTRPLPPTNVSLPERLGIAAQNALTRATNQPGLLEELAYRGVSLLGRGDLAAAFGPLGAGSGPQPLVQAPAPQQHNLSIEVKLKDPLNRPLAHERVNPTRVVLGGKKHGH